MSGTAAHVTDDDSFSAVLRCRDPNGEVCTLIFSWTRLTLSSYTDDAIRTAVGVWADTVPALVLRFHSLYRIRRSAEPRQRPGTDDYPGAGQTRGGR